MLVTGPSSVLPFKCRCSSRADAAAVETSVRVCSVIVDGGVLPASSSTEKERAPLRYAGLGLGSAALRRPWLPAAPTWRRYCAALPRQAAPPRLSQPHSAECAGGGVRNIDGDNMERRINEL